MIAIVFTGFQLSLLDAVVSRRVETVASYNHHMTYLRLLI